MRTLKVGATEPRLRFYIADADGPVDLSTGVTGLALATQGPETFTASLSPDAGQDQPAPVDGLSGVGWCSCAPPADLDPGRYACVVTRNTGSGAYRYPEDGYEVIEVQEVRNAAAAVSDVQRRLGLLWNDSYADQTAYLLSTATDLAAGAVDMTPSELCALEPIPPQVRAICVEAAVRVLLNPDSSLSRQMQLGAYLESRSFAQQGPLATTGVMLTEAEERRVRQAVYGASAGSARLRGTFNDAMLETYALCPEDDRLDYPA